MAACRSMIDRSLLFPSAICNTCGKKEVIKKCSRCSQVFYCSNECQIRNFFDHHGFCLRALHLSADVIKRFKQWFQINYSGFKFLVYKALMVTDTVNTRALILPVSTFEGKAGKPFFHLTRYQFEHFETISFETMLSIKRLEIVARKKILDLQKGIKDKALLILTINTIR